MAEVLYEYWQLDEEVLSCVFTILLCEVLLSGNLANLDNDRISTCRLDSGEGSYVKELEEDFDVLDAMSSVHEIVLASENKCDEFKEHYVEYSYLWTRHLPESLQVLY